MIVAIETLDVDLPSVAFRRFESLEYAKALTNGKIWITTLAQCRATEDVARRDGGEGTLKYRVGLVSGHGTDPGLQLASRRLGLSVRKGDRDITIYNCQRERVISDAWVLCMSERIKEPALRKGDFVVRITNFRRFAELATHALVREKGTVSTTVGRIRYNEREYSDLEPEPGPHLGFIKPRDPYYSEREVRILWTPSAHVGRIDPFLLDCEAIRACCSN